jgi:hypothetical protein
MGLMGFTRPRYLWVPCVTFDRSHSIAKSPVPLNWLSAIGYRLLAIGYSRSVPFAQRAICYLQFSILIL